METSNVHLNFKNREETRAFKKAEGQFDFKLRIFQSRFLYLLATLRYLPKEREFIILAVPRAVFYAFKL